MGQGHREILRRRGGRVTGKVLSFLGVVVVLAGAYLVALDLARSMRLTPGGDGGTVDIGGPKMVLRGGEVIGGAAGRPPSGPPGLRLREANCGGAGAREPWRSNPRGAGSSPEPCRLRESEGENVREKRGRSGTLRRGCAGGAVFLLPP